MDRETFEHIYALAEHFAFLATGETAQTAPKSDLGAWMAAVDQTFNGIAKQLGYYRGENGEGWEHPALV